MNAWHDGKIVDERDITVSPLSHSFSRGTAIFEVLELVLSHRGPAIFGLPEHIERMYRSAQLMHIPLQGNITPEVISRAVLDTVRANNLSKGIIKIFVFFPAQEYSCVPSDKTVSVAIFCASFHALENEKRVFTAYISKFRKNHPESVPVYAKVAGHYVNSYLALTEAIEKGYDEAIMLDTMGFVAEGGTSNIFIVKDGILVTPTLRSILSGITRKFILDIASGFMECHQRDITVEELLAADEVFFSNSVERIMPICRIGNREISITAPGPCTINIMNAINDIISGNHPAFNRWLTLVE